MGIYNNLALVDIHLEPVRNQTALSVNGVLDDDQVLASIFHGDLVARFDLIGRDIDLFAIDTKMAVVDKLTGLGPRGSETRTPNNVVETLLQNFKEAVTRDSVPTRCLFVIKLELLLEYAVHGAKLLLLAELYQVVALANATTTVLTRRIGATLDRTALRLTQRCAGTTARLVTGTDVTGHDF
jgi:hypothetical protein